MNTPRYANVRVRTAIEQFPVQGSGARDNTQPWSMGAVMPGRWSAAPTPAEEPQTKALSAKALSAAAAGRAMREWK